MILYIFFHDFIQVYSPGAGADNPLGVQFWCQQEHLFTSVICCKFQKISLKSDFIQIFFMIYTCTVYSHRAGPDSPHGTKVWCQQKCLVTSFICCKLQKIVFEVWFYTNFLWLNTCIQPRGTADRPQGIKFWCQQKGFIILPICSKFQTNLFEVWFHTFFFMIWYCI